MIDKIFVCFTGDLLLLGLVSVPIFALQLSYHADVSTGLDTLPFELISESSENTVAVSWLQLQAIR